ncbi:NAD-dependent epimerase/dehydratase family protein [Paenibacillus sp. TRM 82003]|nr:NAD-dependent epimerase/dehydratase family protein [Paenibacillus sp. TRM 82003]
MKRVLITGEGSYIGTSFKNWVAQHPDKYSVDSISLRDGKWMDTSFESYDVILHTAAIVHDRHRDKESYNAVNRDLTVNIAMKARNEGVKHFIFLSTMGVYGTEIGYITENTPPAPKTLYARSKFEAEQLLSRLGSDNFQIAILRPPLVYGKGCRGNYSRLVSMAKKLPLFPDIPNQRSMIYIDNLSEFLRIIIDYVVGGTYFPQNINYVNTTDMVRRISKAHGGEIKTTKALNGLIKTALQFSGTVRKVFGSFVYDKNMLGGPNTSINGELINYETVTFEKSIRWTEGGDVHI